MFSAGKSSLLVLAVLAGAALCAPLDEEPPLPPGARRLDAADPPPLKATHKAATHEELLLSKLDRQCSGGDTHACLMLKLASYVDGILDKSGDVELWHGLKITQVSPMEVLEEEAGSGAAPRQSDGDSSSDLSRLLSSKLWAYTTSRALSWDALPGAQLLLAAKDRQGDLGLELSLRPTGGAEDGRGKKGGGLGLVLAAAVLKIGLLAGLAFKALVLLVGKAVIVSKLALVLAIVVLLVKLASRQRHVTYEVVAQPHHSHSHVEHGVESYGGGHGWGRSVEAAHDLAYRAHKPE